MKTKGLGLSRVAYDVDTGPKRRSNGVRGPERRPASAGWRRFPQADFGPAAVISVHRRYASSWSGASTPSGASSSNA